MGQFKGIDQLRSNFLGSMAKLYDRYRKRLVSEIRKGSDNPKVPDASAVNNSFWDSFHTDLFAELRTSTQKIYMASAMAHGMNKEDARAASNAYGRGRATANTAEIVANTQRRFDMMDGLLINRERQGQTTNINELRKLSSVVFSASKGRNTAINESTAAASSGAQHAIRQLQLEAEQDEWKTNPSLSKTGPCPVCKPLNGVTRKVWSREFPNGPPAHIGCVCEIKFKNIRSAAATARELRKKGN